jgi:lysophospholipase L1-like esterase
MKMHLSLVAALFLGPWVARSATPPSAPAAFESGDRWCAVGDSITEGGYYHRYVELFYQTRFPKSQLEVIDCGIRGDTAPRAVQRVQWDCLRAKPTVVSVMLGMNDVGWNLIRIPAAEIEKRRAERAQAYDEGLRTLATTLIQAGVKVILIKPSIFDDTAELGGEKFAGGGAALAALANRVHSISEELKTSTVDFNGPMAAINTEQQRRNPRFSIVGPDRVHPTPPGHLVMAYEFLKAQKVPAVVSQIRIDATTRKTGPLVNCSIEKLTFKADEIRFVCHENALPFPVEAHAAPALELVPFTRDLNQQTLKVRGLPPGDYALSIDGQTVRTFSAANLGEGVNLAVEPDAPQLRQAQKVLAALQLKWKAQGALRGIAFIEHNLWPNADRPLQPNQISTELDAGLEKIAAGNPSWRAQLKKNYLEAKPREAELKRELEAAVATARSTAQTQPHEFALRRVTSRSEAPLKRPR